MRSTGPAPLEVRTPRNPEIEKQLPGNGAGRGGHLIFAISKRRYALDTHRTTRRKVLGSLALGAGALFSYPAIGSNWAAYAQDETHELTWATNNLEAVNAWLAR